METVTYQRGPTRSRRCCRRGSRCPNSRPELQVTDATALGPARPGSAGGGGDPDRGSGRSPQTSGVARPRDPSLQPSSAGAAEFGGVWEPPPDLLPKLGGKWEPSPHFSENFPSWGPPRSLSHSYPLARTKSPTWVCPWTPQTFIFKLPELGLLGTSSYFTLKSLSWGRPGTTLSLPLNFLKHLNSLP